MLFGQIAQLVEHRTENPGVGGSIPPLPIFTTREGFPIESGTLFLFVATSARRMLRRAGSYPSIIADP